MPSPMTPAKVFTSREDLRPATERLAAGYPPPRLIAMARSEAAQSLRRTFLVLEYLADHPGSRLCDVAEVTHLAPPTALRFLSSLVALGYVRCRDHAYFVAARLAALSRGVWHEEVAAAVAAALGDLAERSGMIAYFTVPEADEAVYLSRALPRRVTIQSTQRIGHRAPLYCTGVGKIYLAVRSDAEVTAYTQRTDMVRLTPRTISHPVHLLTVLNEVRRQGYALDDEECEIGVRCLAVAVRDGQGRTRAAISISGPESLLEPEAITDKAAWLHEAARSIARSLPATGAIFDAAQT
jgi:DNA-binding IclR family transcriptional regulator